MADIGISLGAALAAIAGGTASVGSWVTLGTFVAGTATIGFATSWNVIRDTAFQGHEEEYYLVEALISQGAATGTQLVESMGYAETARMKGAAAKNQGSTKSHEYSQFGTVENGRGEEYEKFLKEGSKEGLTDAEKYGVARVDMKGDSNSANLGNKLDYLFGKASGDIHNIQRSKAMQVELQKIGIYNTPSGRAYISKHLNEVLKDPSNISNVEVKSYIAKELPGKPILEYTATTRESLLMGPGGAVKVESVWDGNRLLTVIVKGGN